MRQAILTGVLLAGTVPAAAEVRVVATTSSMAMLVREIGGSAVSITTLAPPDRDPHYLLARPSMMVALRRADLLVAVGAELEVGWLPAAIQGASNPKILVGQPGYFEGAAQIDLIETGQVADRSRGDVHPMGNPHYYMDPVRMARVGRALAARLGALDPARKDEFANRAEAFAEAVDERAVRWRQQAAGAAGVVLYHKDANYLALFLGIPVLGYIEPLPGIPPTASHLRDLVARLSGTQGVILYNGYHPSEGPAFLSRQLGWKSRQLQLEVPLEATGSTYLDHIEQWVRASTGATP
ncbi:MAG: zinc ABC transporter substrate-binding protein [Acidobacteria bacterium]|nr:zinc ABC transporter substrate-binding protein [Acidobacteriota bacterium]